MMDLAAQTNVQPWVDGAVVVAKPVAGCLDSW